MSDRIRAAIIGGSGFGKYHAQWYAKEGAEVLAFCCSSADSAEAARSMMTKLTGQNPRPYADARAMLRAERPDVVSVCTPPAEHIEPTLRALDAGAHVLCEKPLNDGTRRDETIAEADRLLNSAVGVGRVLAVNLQYAALPEPFLRLYEREWGAFTELISYAFDMESKGNRRGRHHGAELWMELGPHALAPLLHLLPNASIDPATVQATVTPDEVVAEFEMREPGGRRVPTRIRNAACAPDAAPLRRLTINGYAVDVTPYRDEEGTFQTQIQPVSGGDGVVVDDLMRVSVRRFLAAAEGKGTTLVSGLEGRRNLVEQWVVQSRLQA